MGTGIRWKVLEMDGVDGWVYSVPLNCASKMRKVTKKKKVLLYVSTAIEQTETDLFFSLHQKFKGS